MTYRDVFELTWWRGSRVLNNYGIKEMILLKNRLGLQKELQSPKVTRIFQILDNAIHTYRTLHSETSGE